MLNNPSSLTLHEGCTLVNDMDLGKLSENVSVKVYHSFMKVEDTKALHVNKVKIARQRSNNANVMIVTQIVGVQSSFHVYGNIRISSQSFKSF